MLIKPILTYPDEFLTRKAPRVGNHEFVFGFKGLTEYMIRTMRDHNGMGLAAPQIGVAARVIVVDSSVFEELHHDSGPVVMVNPEITFRSLERNVQREGCLSLPNTHSVPVIRSNCIDVTAMNVYGETFYIKNLGGWGARCVQHEVDHLDGVLINDRGASISDLRDLYYSLPDTDTTYQEDAFTILEEVQSLYNSKSPNP